MIGCASHTVPVPVEPPPSVQPSWDENQQNSGIVAIRPDGLLVTPHFRARYDAMAAKYGGGFDPQVFPGDGFRLVPVMGTNQNLLDAEHMVKFLDMNRWRKQDRPAVPPKPELLRPSTWGMPG